MRWDWLIIIMAGFVSSATGSVVYEVWGFFAWLAFLPAMMMLGFIAGMLAYHVAGKRLWE